MAPVNTPDQPSQHFSEPTCPSTDPSLNVTQQSPKQNNFLAMPFSQAEVGFF
jgi:hypothetical protein